jgi:hypothetical protein
LDYVWTTVPVIAAPAILPVGRPLDRFDGQEFSSYS